MFLNALVRSVIDNVAIIDIFTDDKNIKVMKMIVNYDKYSKTANHKTDFSNAIKEFGKKSSCYSIQDLAVISKQVSAGHTEFASIVCNKDVECDPFKHFSSRQWKTLFTLKDRDDVEHILVKI